MDRTNRDIINSFVGRAPAFYIPARIPAGRFTGEIAGYPGLLSINARKGQSTDFVIANWDAASTNPARPDTVTFQLRPYIPLGTMTAAAEDNYFNRGGLDWQIQVSSGASPITIQVPQSNRPPGVWLVRVQYTNFLGTQTNRSVAQLLIVDDTAPFDRSGDKPPPPLAPVGMPLPLTRANFLGAPGQTLEFPVPYTLADGLSDDDTIAVFWDGRPVDFPPTGRRLPITRATPPSIPFPLSAYDAHPGNYELTYQIIDVTGNLSQQSYGLLLGDLALAPPPTGFQLPTVDSAVPGDGLIDRIDMATSNGAIVRVPAIQNILPTDIITVNLSNGVTTIPRPLQANAFPFPIPFQFTQADLATLYGAGPGTVPLTASYSVTRGGVTLPATPLSVNFNLDLFLVGPNPNPGPNVPNTDLLPVVVNALRPGGLLGPNNTLELEDVNRDAQAVIPLWTAPPLPDAQLPFVVELHYGTAIISQTVTTIDPSREVVFQIPFATILAQGNGTVTAFYTVSAPGSRNSQRSPDTPVTVAAAVLQMDAPVVLGTVGEPPIVAVGCLSLTPAGMVRLFIPPSRYLSVGEPVTVTFTGFQNDTTTPPGLLPITRTFNLPGVAALTAGFEVDLESSTVLFNPIHATRALRDTGSATVTYQTRFGGALVNSSAATVFVSAIVPGEQGTSYYCDGGIIP